MPNISSPGFLGLGGVSSNSNSALIFAPDILGLGLFRGQGSAGTSIRSSTGTFRNHDVVAGVAGAILKTAEANQHRIDNGREVVNLLSYPEDLTNAAWTVSDTATKVGIVAGVGPNGESAMEISFGSNVSAHLDNLMGTETFDGDSRTKFYVRAVSGNAIVRVRNGAVASPDIALTTEWKWITSLVTVAVSNQSRGVQNNSAGTSANIYVLKGQAEDVTGQANQNPSEYVGGSGAGPFRRIFDTTNGNTVSSNVVTEAAGIPLHPKVNAPGVPTYWTYPNRPASTVVVAGDTANFSGYWFTATVGGTTGASDPTPPSIGSTVADNTVTWRNDGYYSDIALLVEGTGTNATPANNFRLAAMYGGWLGTHTEVNNAVGVDGVANSAVTITDTNNTALSAANVWGGTNPTITADTATHTDSVFIKKNQPNIQRLFIRLTGGTAFDKNAYFDSATGLFSTDSDSSSKSEDWGDFWRVTLSATNNGTNTIMIFAVSPCVRTTLNGADDVTLLTACVFDWPQQELNTSVASSPIPGGTIRATEQGNINWPQLANIDITKGTMVAGVKFGYDESLMPNGNYGLLSINTLATSGLYHSHLNIKSYDGANVATTSNPAWLAGDVLHLGLRWDVSTSKFQTGYLRASKFGQSWVWGTEAAFDGTLLQSGTLIKLFVGQFGPVGLRFLHTYRSDLGTTEIERRYS